MKKVLVLGVAALALVGCGAKEEAAAPAVETPVVEATPAPEAAPAVDAAPEAPAPEGVDGGKAVTP